MPVGVHAGRRQRTDVDDAVLLAHLQRQRVDPHEVSRLSADLDELVEAWRNRPPDAGDPVDAHMPGDVIHPAGRHTST